jgi:hypothetical protein
LTVSEHGAFGIPALLDEAVSRRVLEVLQPEQLQIALRAVNELQGRSQAIDQQWRMRIERLDYQALLAQRRYEEVDPSYRLVAATLEQRWNQALEEAQRLKDDYQQYRKQQSLELTAKQQIELLALAEDLPRLWQAQTTFGQRPQANAALVNQGFDCRKTPG